MRKNGKPAFSLTPEIRQLSSADSTVKEIKIISEVLYATRKAIPYFSTIGNRSVSHSIFFFIAFFRLNTFHLKAFTMKLVKLTWFISLGVLPRVAELANLSEQ